MGGHVVPMYDKFTPRWAVMLFPCMISLHEVGGHVVPMYDKFIRGERLSCCSHV